MLLGGATFACLLMLKHLFLSLAPLYFVYLLRSYCLRSGPNGKRACRGVGSGGSGGSKGHHLTPAGQAREEIHDELHDHEVSARYQQEEKPAARQLLLCWRRLASLGGVVLCVFAAALGPVCVSDGWTKEACLRQMGQVGARLFPFGRSVSVVSCVGVVVSGVVVVGCCNAQRIQNVRAANSPCFRGAVFFILARIFSCCFFVHELFAFMVRSLARLDLDQADGGSHAPTYASQLGFSSKCALLACLARGFDRWGVAFCCGMCTLRQLSLSPHFRPLNTTGKHDMTTT